MSLSPREQKALAAIEDGLSTTDPALVAALTRADSPSPILQRFPLSARRIGLLVLALFALIILNPLVLQLGAAGSALLTGILVTPWIVSAARAADRRHRHSPGTPASPDQDVST